MGSSAVCVCVFEGDHNAETVNFEFLNGYYLCMLFGIPCAQTYLSVCGATKYIAVSGLLGYRRAGRHNHSEAHVTNHIAVGMKFEHNREERRSHSIH